jgi:hypothetical protein
MANKLLTERKFHIVGGTDPIIDLYFSQQNITSIQDTVKFKVKQSTGVDINTSQDEPAMIIKMQEFIELHRSNRHLFSDKSPSLIVADLNQQIIEHYVSSVVSGIQAYTNYYDMISKPPTNNIPMPTNVSSKGANVLGVNVGFLSSHERNADIRQFNLKYDR